LRLSVNGTDKSFAVLFLEKGLLALPSSDQVEQYCAGQDNEAQAFENTYVKMVSHRGEPILLAV